MTHSPAPEEAIRECPFYGAKPHDEADHWHSTAWEISCDACDVNGISARVWAESKAAAIAAWNRRAGGEREQQLEERVKAFLREFDAFMEHADLYPDDLAEARNELRAALAGQTEGQ